MEQGIQLTEKLLELFDRRAIIKLEKDAAVRTQKYERAASARNKEKALNAEAIEFLKKEAKYELTDSQQMLTDIWMLFELVEPGEKTFSNAINRINVVDLERMSIIKKVEEYKNGTASLDDLHVKIKKSFFNVREDVKKNIQSAIEKIDSPSNKKLFK